MCVYVSLCMCIYQYMCLYTFVYENEGESSELLSQRVSDSVENSILPTDTVRKMSLISEHKERIVWKTGNTSQ